LSSADEFYSFKNGKTYITVRVTSKASLNAVTGTRNGQLLVSVTAAPENNKANREVIGVLSKTLGTAKSKMQIISGSKCRIKVICIDEILVF
jgi:uncharacterized protein (TIGR00251 family)